MARRGFKSGGQVSEETVGAGLSALDGILSLFEGQNNPSAQPLVNASAMRNMATPYSRFGFGGDVSGSLEELQALADEKGISLDELIDMIQSGGDEEEEMIESDDASLEDMEDEEEEDEEEEYKRGGMVKYKRGGMVAIEAEGEEVIQTPNGSAKKIKGAKHEDGGVDMVVPAGTRVYSDRVKMNGESMADRKISREKSTARLAKLLSNSPDDTLLKNTISRTNRNNQVIEEKDTEIQTLLNDAENAKKTFAVGGEVDPENPFQPNEAVRNVSALLSYFSRGNSPLIAPNEVPEESSPLLAGGMSIYNASSPIDEPPASGVKERPNYTTGDIVGIAGNAFNAVAPLLNTQAAAAATKPNINRWKGFGRGAVEANDLAQDISAETLQNTMTDIDSSSATQTARNRNSATSVNTLRSLDAMTTMGANKARGAARDSSAARRMNLLSQRGQIETRNDQMEMAGEERRDIADKQDMDNYFSNRASDLVNLGNNVQGIGRALNTAYSNQVDKNLISQMSKYGLTFDDEGNLISKK